MQNEDHTKRLEAITGVMLTLEHIRAWYGKTQSEYEASGWDRMATQVGELDQLQELHRLLYQY